MKQCNAQNLDAVLAEAQGLVLVDFWASWCGPCRMLAPTVEQVADERDDVLIGKVDVDMEAELAIAYGITSIPTLILFKKGEPVAKRVGVVRKEDILHMIDEEA